jgi:template-activating factor I
VNEEASDKVLEVEQKYNEIRRPVYNKRNDIIRSIPDFWLTAFLSHPVLSDLLTDEDQKVFKYLDSLDVEDFKDVKSGYSINFIFSSNPYFEDTKLTKVFRFSDEGTTSVSGTQPRWKDGMDLTNGVIQDKEGHKRSHVEDSFFKWFYDTQQKEAMDSLQDEVQLVLLFFSVWFWICICYCCMSFQFSVFTEVIGNETHFLVSHVAG